MPEKKDGGWLLDDKPAFTPEQLSKIQELIKSGKKDDAQKLIDEILKKK